MAIDTCMGHVIGHCHVQNCISYITVVGILQGSSRGVRDGNAKRREFRVQRATSSPDSRETEKECHMAMQVDVHGGRRPAAPHCNRSPAATFRLFPALFGHAADGFPGHVRAVVVDIRERILSSLPDLMAVCTMETLAVGNPGRGLAASEGMSGRRDGLVAWTPQRVLVSARVQRRWPSVVSAHVAGARLRFRCHATSGDGPPKKVRVSMHFLFRPQRARTFLFAVFDNIGESCGIGYGF